MTNAQKKEKELIRLRKAFENLQYIIIVALLGGQVLVGKNFVLGQAFYLVANIISTYRCFALGRPMSDKVKDIFFTGITMLLILGYYF